MLGRTRLRHGREASGISAGVPPANGITGVVKDPVRWFGNPKVKLILGTSKKHADKASPQIEKRSLLR
jgi:hypothetical protein